MNDEELLRYSRQIMLPEIDIDGQQALADARVLIVGLGGLGSPVALYLAAAGVGQLVLVDHDTVELSNLQRQILHEHNTIGLDKTESAERRIKNLNNNTLVTTATRKIEVDDVLFDQVDVVVDGSDNFATRYLVNDACRMRKTPLVSGAAIRWEGQLSVFDFRNPDSPCYRCLYTESAAAAEDEDLSCATNGVIAPIVGVIGSLQALETIKLITNTGDPLVGRVLYFDAKSLEFRTFNLARDATCPLCSES